MRQKPQAAKWQTSPTVQNTVFSLSFLSLAEVLSDSSIGIIYNTRNIHPDPPCQWCLNVCMRHVENVAMPFIIISIQFYNIAFEECDSEMSEAAVLFIAYY